jgi:hypothetical protein
MGFIKKVAGAIFLAGVVFAILYMMIEYPNELADIIGGIWGFIKGFFGGIARFIDALQDQ